MKAMSKKKKYTARRKRASSLLSLQFYCSCMTTIFHKKVDTRSLVVLQSEMEKWKQLSIEFMSEESDDAEDEQTIILHPLLWRSKCL